MWMTQQTEKVDDTISECETSVDEMHGSTSVSISKPRGCYDAESTKKYKDDEFSHNAGGWVCFIVLHLMGLLRS